MSLEFTPPLETTLACTFDEALAPGRLILADGHEQVGTSCGRRTRTGEGDLRLLLLVNTHEQGKGKGNHETTHRGREEIGKGGKPGKGKPGETKCLGKPKYLKNHELPWVIGKRIRREEE